MSEAAVIGVADAEFGGALAFVVLEPGHQLTSRRADHRPARPRLGFKTRTVEFHRRAAAEQQVDQAALGRGQASAERAAMMTTS